MEGAWYKLPVSGAPLGCVSPQESLPTTWLPHLLWQAWPGEGLAVKDDLWTWLR